MTNFKALLKIDYNKENMSNVDKQVSKFYENELSQLKTLLKNSYLSNKDELNKVVTDSYLKTIRQEPDKRLLNGNMLYYYWLRYLYITIAHDFLKDDKSRQAFEKVEKANDDGKNSKSILNEKYAADLYKEFMLNLGKNEYNDMPDEQILKKFTNGFMDIVHEGEMKEFYDFDKYISKRIAAEKAPSLYPDLLRKTKVEKIDSDKSAKEKEEPKETNKHIEKQPKEQQSHGEIKIPGFMNDKYYNITINDRTYEFSQRDIVSKVGKDNNKIAFNLIYSAIIAYENDINSTSLVVRSTNFFDKIKDSVKKFFNSLRVTNYDFDIDGRKFRVNSRELEKFKSSNGHISDFANLAYGKYRNVIFYPNELYVTDDDFKNLLSGQIINISDKNYRKNNSNNTKEEGPYPILVFDNSLKDSDFINPGARNLGYIREAYKYYEENICKDEPKDEKKPNKKPKGSKIISFKDYKKDKESKKAEGTEEKDNKELDHGEL